MSRLLAGDVLAEAPDGRRSLIVAVVMTLIMTASELSAILFLARALDRVLRGATAGLSMDLAGIGASVVVAAVASFLAETQAQRTVGAVTSSLRRRALREVLRLGLAYVAQDRTGNLQVLLVDGVDAAATYVGRVVPAIVMAVLGPLLVLLVFAVLDWPTSLMLAGLVLSLPAMTAAWLAWRMPKSGWIFESIGAFNAQLLDGLQGMTTLKAENATLRWRSTIASTARDLRVRAMATLRTSLFREALSTCLSVGGPVGVLAIAVWRFKAGTADSFVVLATLLGAREALRPIQRLEAAFHGGFAGREALSKLQALFGAEGVVPDDGAIDRSPRDGSITFKDVSFSYPGSARPVVDKLSFHVDHGRTLALVGASGAGKSTIAALLQRFYDPDEGSIELGGTDLRALSLAALRRSVSVVSQETYLFPGTIAENIRLGSPDATDEAIFAAARAAHLDDFIRSLPASYETQVGEAGGLLSGGQKQRLAIARAILREAPLVILDESTASLDAESERAVLASLEALRGRRTLLIISHRQAPVRSADAVLVLNAGAIES